MKIFTSMMALALVAATASAQQLDRKAAKVSAIDFMKAKSAVKHADVTPLAPIVKGAFKAPARKTVATGLYYTAPQGSMYYSWNLQGSGYGCSYLIVPAYQDLVFADSSSTASTNVWQYLKLDQATKEYSWNDLTRGEDYLQNGADVTYLSGSYVLPGGSTTLWAPMLSSSDMTDSYVLGENNYYYETYGSAYTAMVGTDSISYKTFVDDHGSTGAWGALDNDNLFGTGTYTSQSGTKYVSYAVAAMLPKPASPLYVENVYVQGISITGTPLAEGTQLYMEIMDAETGDSITTLTASSTDTTKVYSYTRNSVPVTLYNLVMSAKEKDDITGEDLAAPFVIDRSVIVLMYGFNQEGVDFGPAGIIEESGANTQSAAIYMYEEGNTENLTSLGYRSVITPYIAFNSMFDMVEIEKEYTYEGTTYTNTNVLRVSADGQTVTNESGDGTNYVSAYTGMIWHDEYDNENYYAEEMPDWIQGIITNDTYYSKYGVTLVSVLCDPLPDGVTGRAANLWIQGHGVAGATPITVLQGDATIETAIQDVKAMNKNLSNGQAYNLQGQRVSKSTKGLLIKDGKKFFNK